MTINKFAIQPDLTVILDVDPFTALKRKGVLREKFEVEEFLSKVREKFLHRAKLMGYVVIDAGQTIEEVQAEIRTHVAKLLGIS